jgi:hypothetical protein
VTPDYETAVLGLGTLGVCLFAGILAAIVLSGLLVF